MTGMFRKPWFSALFLLAAAVGVYFGYVSLAFPPVRCEAAKHLDAPPERMSDCYGCHVKTSPKLAQEWHESKHGVTLVKCQACHGLPDGKGSMAFTRTPGAELCSRCHSLSIERMEAKFGKRDDCVTCHPAHQTPMHGTAYTYRQETAVTTLD
jgi:hypothetical protein